MELQYLDGPCDTGLPVPWDPGRVPGNKKPRAVSGRGKKKAMGRLRQPMASVTAAGLY